MKQAKENHKITDNINNTFSINIDNINNQEIKAMNVLEKYCTKEGHNTYKISLLRTDADQDEKPDNYTICIRCNTQQQINGSDLILLDQLYSDDPKLIMDNYPMFSKNVQISIQNQLNEIIQISKDFYPQKLKEIQQFYEELKSQINNALENSLKEMTTYVEKYKDFDSEVLQSYRQMQQKEELRNLIKSLPDGKNELELFLQEQNKKRESNTKQIEDDILSFHNKRILYQKEQALGIQKYILQLLSEINFFSTNNNNNNNNNSLYEHLQMFKYYAYIDEQQQDEIVEQKKQKLQQLLKNESNFCSSKFIKETKEFLDIIPKQLYSKIDLNTIHYNNILTPINFNKVSMFNLKQVIEDLSIQKPKKQTKMDGVANCMIWEDDSINDEDDDDNNYFFENDEINKNKDHNKSKIRGSQDIFIIPTKLNQSDQSINIQPKNGLITIEKINNIQKSVQCVTSFNLNPYHVHIFRYRLRKSNQDDHYLYAGLIKESSMNTHRIQEENKYQGSLIEHSFTQSVKSSNNNNNNNNRSNLLLKGQQIKYDTFEMRIHIGENFIQLCDYPEYSNIYTIRDLNENAIIPNEKYRFGFEFYTPQQGEKFELFYYREGSKKLFENYKKL